MQRICSLRRNFAPSKKRKTTFARFKVYAFARTRNAGRRPGESDPFARPSRCDLSTSRHDPKKKNFFSFCPCLRCIRYLSTFARRDLFPAGQRILLLLWLLGHLPSTSRYLSTTSLSTFPSSAVVFAARTKKKKTKVRIFGYIQFDCSVCSTGEPRYLSTDPVPGVAGARHEAPRHLTTIPYLHRHACKGTLDDSATFISQLSA